MSFELPVLQKMTPSMRRSVLATAGALITAVVLIFFAVLPTRARLATIRKEIDDLNISLTKIRSDIEGTERQRSKTSALSAERDAILASGVIEPLLGSFAMRGKTLVEPFAQATGFMIESVKELPAIPLQLPTPAPEQVYARQPVEFTGYGSYTQITAFITYTEASLPLATLSSLQIQSQQQSPEVHRAVIAFEWPTKGEKRLPSVTKTPVNKPTPPTK